MLLFMLLGCIIAKLRKLRVGPIFRDWSLIPMAACELIYIAFQICVISGEHRVIRYSSALQTAFILSTLFPVLRHRLYRQAIAGFLMVASGTALNKAAMNANGGIMPVHPTLSRVTGYFTYEAINSAEDAAHGLLTESTKLKFLCDYIDVGYSILSPGDVIIHALAALVIYYVVKSHNEPKQTEVASNA